MYKLFVDKRYFKCWKNISDIETFRKWMGWFLDIIFNNDVVFVENEKKCDFYITECTNPNILNDKMNIILCGESDTRYRYTQLMLKYIKSNNVKFIGTVEDTDISFNIPILNKHGINFDPYTFVQNTENKSFTYRFEMNGKNNVFVRRNIEANRELMSKIINSKLENGEDKSSILQKYVFNFCPENSKSTFGGSGGYITEKIYDCVYNGCIPIYYGGDLEKYSILNKNRVFQIDIFNIQNTYRMISNMNVESMKNLYEFSILREDCDTFVNNRKNMLKDFVLS